MSDLIRREDALRVTLAYSSSYSAEQAENAIRALPAVQPDARIKEYEEAYQYALHLAKALRENYPLNPDFRFLGDLVGLLTQIDNMVAGLSLTTERDAAYARGYSDAETEISKSALGQKIDFLHSQYADAKLRIEALTVDRAEARAGWHKYEGAWMTAEGKLADVEAERDRLREALEYILAECTLSDNTVPSVGAIKYAARAALKGESHD